MLKDAILQTALGKAEGGFESKRRAAIDVLTRFEELRTHQSRSVTKAAFRLASATSREENRKHWSKGN